MDPNTINQAINLIDKSQNILLLTHAKADCDGLGAVLATYLVLKGLGKDVTAVTNDPTPENLAFLPSISIVQNSMASAKDFIISLDTARTPLSKIKYNLEGNRVNIIVTPKSGVFSKEDVSFAQGTSKFDLIISMDAGNLEHLGPIYDQNSELFFETPIINIDHHASNTDFGQVNMVDVVAASTTEVLYHVLKAMEKKYEKKLITEDIATLLLAGIITDTGSFQHANTSPKSMEVSAKLLDLGARQQEIIKNIYKTKKLSTLKLWGIVLSKVQVDPMHRMVWSTISKDDIQEADAEPDESEGIIDDLLSNAPGAEVIMLIKENKKEGYISVSMRSTTNAVDVGKITSEMGGGGHVRAAGYKVRDNKSFDQVVSEILEKVRQYQAKRLNIHPEDLNKKEEKPREEQAAPPSEATAPQAKLAPREAAPQKSTYLEFKSPPEKKSEPVKPQTTSLSPTKPKRRKRPPRNRPAEQKPVQPAQPQKTPEPKPQPQPTPQKREPEKTDITKTAQKETPKPKEKLIEPAPALKPPKTEGEQTPPEVPDWLKEE
jgi:phosphoesterase RecJ-like protein